MRLILFLMVVFLSGCKTFFAPEPLNELNYKSEIPSEFKDFQKYRDFVNELALNAGLRISVEPKAFSRGESETELLTVNSPKIVVDVILYEDRNQLRILIYGTLETPEVKALAKKIEEFYAQKYPALKLEPFVRYRGLLGP